MYRAFIFLSLLILTFGCKHQQYTPSNLPETYITFGSFGGFTGAADTYYLFQSGKMFHENSLSEKWTELEPAKKRAAKRIFKTISKELSAVEVNKNGNMNQFIRLHANEVLSWQWPSGDTTIPASLKDSYASLNDLIRQKDEN